jgi:hypothetical protein
VFDLNDLDMLYDYYTSINLASGAYATISSRIKNDNIEKLFRKLAQQAMMDSQAASEMIIKLGGKIY